MVERCVVKKEGVLLLDGIHAEERTRDWVGNQRERESNGRTNREGERRKGEGGRKILCTHGRNHHHPFTKQSKNSSGSSSSVQATIMEDCASSGTQLDKNTRT